MQKKETRQTHSFSVLPSVVKEAKDNVWKERKSLSQVIECLLKKYNSERKKQAV